MAADSTARVMMNLACQLATRDTCHGVTEALRGELAKMVDEERCAAGVPPSSVAKIPDNSRLTPQVGERSAMAGQFWSPAVLAQRLLSTRA
jgi:hypothetical protein